MKITEEIPVEPGQKYETGLFREEDAKGIANLYYSIYGPNYPFETYYIPEKITEENRNGNIYSVVARTPKGDIIAHGALYRSSAHHKNLYEYGQYISLKNYRNSFAIFKINKYITGELVISTGIDGYFGEAVGHHTATQKTSAIAGAKDCAIEIDLMPAELYEKEKILSNRVSCIMAFKILKDRSHEIFIPLYYEEAIKYIMSDLDINRKISFSKDEIPPGLKSEFSVKFFTHASVGRFNVITGGADFEAIVTDLEEEGRKNNILVYQYFLNADRPWTEKLTDILRKKGYFFGGYLPRWFDTDGILMHKILSVPDLDHICLYTEKAKKILEFIRKDIDRISVSSYQ